MFPLENQIICPNCGKENDFSSVFCSECNTKLTQNNHGRSDNNPSKDEDTIQEQTNHTPLLDGGKLGILSLVLWFIGPVILSIIYFLDALFFDDSIFPTMGVFFIILGLCYLSSIIITIYGRIKYPTEKLLKIVGWLIIASIIVTILLLIYFIYFGIPGLENLY